MTLYNGYLEWQQGVAKWLDVTEGDVYDQIPEFIRLAEIELDNRLHLRDAIRRATNTIDNDGVLTLPDDFNKMKVITLTTDGRTLDAVTPDRYGDQYRLSGGTGQEQGFQDGWPVNYTIIGHKIYFFPRGAGLDVNMAYYRKAEPLSDLVPNNIYTDYCPEILLAGAVSFGMKALFEEERMAMWEQKFAQGIIDRARREQAEELGSSPLVARPPLRRRSRGYG